MPLQQISVSPLDWAKESANSRNCIQDKKRQEPIYTTSSPNPPERCASQASSLSNGHDICRICHCEGDSDVPLIAPCYCSGSLRYVHQGCLQQWIKSSDIRSCELCKFQFIMQSKIKPFSEWEMLEMSGVERRKLLCSVTFHAVALTCVVWSLYVLIDRTAEEIERGVLEWPFWTKLIVVAIGITGGLIFMYIQCKAYLHLCRRWRAFNRVIFVQNAPEKTALPSLAREESLLVSETCCGVVASEDSARIKYKDSDVTSSAIESILHESRKRNTSNSRKEEKLLTSPSTVEETLMTAKLDRSSENLLQKVVIIDNTKNFQSQVLKPVIVGFNGSLGTDAYKQCSDIDNSLTLSRKYSYDDSESVGEEMSHLLESEDRNSISVSACPVSVSKPSSASGFLLLPTTLTPPVTHTSCAVSMSSSEESLQSATVPLQNNIQPWTVGQNIAWITDTSSEHSSGQIHPTSSLGSQSPLLMRKENMVSTK